MCNLYSVTKGQSAILEFTRAMVDRTGNLPPLPGIFPDTSAPVVRSINGRRELTTMRWGMPSPVFALKGRSSDPGVTNIRNTKSPHWRRWLSPESRCLVPLTSFILRARDNPIARVVKLADLADNSDRTRLKKIGPREEQRLEKYAKATRMLFVTS